MFNAVRWQWLVINLELTDEIKELYKLGLNTEEILGSLDMMLDNIDLERFNLSNAGVS